jgi:hypothetical protein
MKPPAFLDAVISRAIRAFIQLTAIILLFQTATARATDESPLRLSNETVYRVTITTSLDLKPNSGIPLVRVSHGLPVERPWSDGEHKSSGREVKFEPAKGKLEHDRKSGASYISWEERVSSKGGPMVFTTTYETTSFARELHPESAAKAKWTSRRVRMERDTHPEIIEQAKLLIKEPNPLEALNKFGEWIDKRITYDASVDNRSVDDTLKNGAGHCGHWAAVLRQFCAALGIESRPIGGSNLRHPDGATDELLFQLNPTWSNTHAWVELNIPGVGWVEVEPAGKQNIFAVPANYVQTRGNFQNYDVRIMQNGKWVRPTWETVTENGSNRFTSNIGLRNVITFEILGEKAGEATDMLGLPGALNSVGGLLRYRKPDGAVQVEVRGSFDGWQNIHVLTENAEDAAIAEIDIKSIGLSEGKYEYKFLVDGKFEEGPNRTLSVGPDGSPVN